MIIQNKKDIATTELRKQALDIIEVGINRVLPSNLMKSPVKYDSARRVLIVNDNIYDLSKGRLFVIGGGKASGLMAETLESIVNPEDITAGIVNCISSDCELKKIKIIEAQHPIPDERGVKGVKEMLALRDSYSINKNDLVICLISGGGSALMPLPVDEISLEDKQKITYLLLSSGAEINEINMVRKHLSKIKGGCLGRFYSPAKVVSLILSDAPGNNLDVVASGPTSPDFSTSSDALNVLKKYNLLSKTPKRIITFLRKSSGNEVEETPKNLDNCDNYLIGDNKLALEAMKIKAKEMGFTPHIITSEQKGDPVTVAELRAKEILEGKYKDYDLILIGGETTPKLPENRGKGGRNQRYAAVSMLAMQKYPGKWVVASVATDGSDFLSDVAGAIVDNNSLDTARTKGIDVNAYLDRYDSNTLLKGIDNSLIVTGNTETNVCDIIIYILTPSDGVDKK